MGGNFNWHNARFSRVMSRMHGDAKTSSIVAPAKSKSTLRLVPQVKVAAPGRTLSLDEVKRRLLDRGERK